MLLKLFQAGEPVLRASARELTQEEIGSPEIQKLIRLMRETLRSAPGVGLAAPQVGESVQLAIIEDLPDYIRNLTAREIAERERQPVPFHVIVNPKLIPESGEPKAEFFEGCLSLNGFTALVPRYRRVRVEYLDENGAAQAIDATGWYARILQHEIDHLNGCLYIDRMKSRSFMSLDNYTQYWKHLSIGETKSDLGLQ